MLVPLSHPRCHPINEAIVCGARAAAVREREMLWSDRAPGTTSGGWVFPIPYPFLPGGERRAPRFHWTFCPFCGSTLPVRSRAQPQADGGPFGVPSDGPE
jgi:hypothetical protein